MEQNGTFETHEPHTPHTRDNICTAICKRNVKVFNMTGSEDWIFYLVEKTPSSWIQFTFMFVKSSAAIY